MYQLKAIDPGKILLCVIHLSLVVTGCLVPMVLLSYTLFFAVSNLALSMAILAQKAKISDEHRCLAQTLILQGVLMTIACSLVVGLCVNPVALLVVIALYVGCYGLKTQAYMMDLVDNELKASEFRQGITVGVVAKALRKASISEWVFAPIL